MTSPSSSLRRFLLVREEFSACLNKSSQEVAAPGIGALPGSVFLHGCNGQSYPGNLGTAFFGVTVWINL